MPSHLEQRFPNLRTGEYSETSAQTREYNCFAYAVGIVDQWLSPDPDYSWISDNREETIAGYIEAFRNKNFEICASGDIEDGFDKLALYAHMGVPTHVARQLPDGTWTSKLGCLEDITHTLNGLTGTPNPYLPYGQVVQFLRRHR